MSSRQELVLYSSRAQFPYPSLLPIHSFRKSRVGGKLRIFFKEPLAERDLARESIQRAYVSMFLRLRAFFLFIPFIPITGDISSSVGIVPEFRTS